MTSPDIPLITRKRQRTNFCRTKFLKAETYYTHRTFRWSQHNITGLMLRFWSSLNWWAPECPLITNWSPDHCHGWTDLRQRSQDIPLVKWKERRTIRWYEKNQAELISLTESKFQITTQHKHIFGPVWVNPLPSQTLIYKYLPKRL